MITISQNIIFEIFEQAFRDLPNETCGLLVGKENEITKIFPLTNTDQSPEHFSFDPVEQFQVLRAARSEGLSVIANYHSHPASPARPSVEDIRLAYDSNILYFIASLEAETPVLKAFQIIKEQVTEVEINVIQ
jgi:[CysO sulfur-carrier protein]-S-L-cysteine hydrolase